MNFLARRPASISSRYRSRLEIYTTVYPDISGVCGMGTLAINVKQCTQKLYREETETGRGKWVGGWGGFSLIFTQNKYDQTCSDSTIHSLVDHCFYCYV